MGSSAIKPVVGILLDLNAKGVVKEGIRFYSTHNYKIALTIFPASLILALLALIFLRRKGMGISFIFEKKLLGSDSFSIFFSVESV